jgi:hypothetical protein
MAKVGIVMGSDSDMEVMAKAADVLEEFGVEYEMTIISAHREPDVFFEYAKGAEERGYKVIIAGSEVVGNKIKEAYTDGGLRDFDVHFMERVYEQPFSVEIVAL